MRLRGLYLAAVAAQTEVPVRPAHVLDSLVLGQLGTEVLGLVDQTVGKLGRGQLGLAGEVDHRLAGVEVDELAAKGVGLEDHGREAAHLGVHRRRKPTGAATDDGDIVAAHLILPR